MRVAGCKSDSTLLRSKVDYFLRSVPILNQAPFGEGANRRQSHVTVSQARNVGHERMSVADPAHSFLY
jgi:hypothetical protein